MKTVYCTPEMTVVYPNMVLMMDKASNPNDEPILSKERGYDDDVKQETDSWSDGLW